MSNFPKNDPTEGEGVYKSQFCQSKFVGLAWPLALNISFCLRTLRLSIKNLQLNSGVCESFKKTGNGGKSSFWSPPVSLGSTKFSKTCIACTTYSKFPYPFNSKSCLLFKDSFVHTRKCLSVTHFLLIKR